MVVCVRTFFIFVLAYFEIEGYIFIFSVYVFFGGVFSLFVVLLLFVFLLIILSFDLDTFVLLIFSGICFIRPL